MANSDQPSDPTVQLREYVARGGYGPGAKLPPERKLTDDLGLSRSTLRKALDVLEREGVIWRHVGRGTFVSQDTEVEPPDALVDLGRKLTPFRMMRARVAIEPAIAREAAINASADDIAQMEMAQQAAYSAETWRAYEKQDDLLHRAVAEAADNPLLLYLFDQLNQVRRAVAVGNVTRRTARPSREHVSFAEHEVLVAAIRDHDPQAAYEAMRTHLRSVSARLFEVG